MIVLRMKLDRKSPFSLTHWTELIVRPYRHRQGYAGCYAALARRQQQQQQQVVLVLALVLPQLQLLSLPQLA